jgi:hypothetical protein
MRFRCPYKDATFSFVDHFGENPLSHIDAPSYTDIKQSLVVNGYSESSPLFTSVGDPHVFGPLGSGSGSISQRYESSSGSFPFLINVLIELK